MSASVTPPIILSFEDARRVVEEHAKGILPPQTESIDLLHCAGRALAENVVADRDLPPFPRSTRDGYAVRSADLASLPANLRVIGEIKAGERIEQIPTLEATGQAVAIMTGAPVPQGADAVVMVEFTALQGESVEISRGVVTGENIVQRGAEAGKGNVLVPRGFRLNDASIALAASVGKSLLQVYKKPNVAILTTGDEIVNIDTESGPTQIRNSNAYSLAVQVTRAGGIPVILPIAPDESQVLRKLIEQGLQSDLLLLTGGVSMGRYDLVEQVLSGLRAEFFFTGAKIQPGRPVVFGSHSADKARAGGKSTYFFGLPGNPVSTMVTFELFARPLLEALAGMTPRKLTFAKAKLDAEIRVKPGLKRFLPALISGEFDDCRVELVPWQGSGDIAATARADCYIVVPPDVEEIAVGQFVSVMLR
jgi:molybdopterin molybdotransferase